MYACILYGWGEAYIRNEGNAIYVNELAYEMGFRNGDRILMLDDYKPEDFQMLQADLATLRGEYDHVFIRVKGGIRRGGSFFAQLLGVCDSALVVAGAGATARASLAYARRCIKESGKPAMGLATGVKTKVVKAEMEVKA